jgi:hypothetical protein
MAASQILGIAQVAPLYFILTLLTSDNPIYQRTSGRIVDSAIAKAAMPALGLGFIIPSVLMFVPFSPGVWPAKIAILRLAPIAVGPLAAFIAGRIRSREGPQEPDPHQLKMFENGDLPWLQASYAAVFLVTGVFHIWTMASILSSSRLSVMSVFWTNVVSDFFKWDLAIYAACLAIWCVQSVFDMRRMGYITSSTTWMAAMAVTASTVAVGPASTYSGLWFWRERTIARLSK